MRGPAVLRRGAGEVRCADALWSGMTYAGGICWYSSREGEKIRFTFDGRGVALQVNTMRPAR
jgi:hypothetical protein